MINCKSHAELDKMRRSGIVLRQVLDTVKAMVAPGVSTMDLERVAEEKIREHGANPRSRDTSTIPACCARR